MITMIELTFRITAKTKQNKISPASKEAGLALDMKSGAV